MLFLLSSPEIPGFMLVLAGIFWLAGTLAQFWLIFQAAKPAPAPLPDKSRRLSLLIAVRDEAGRIAPLLESLDALDYPSGKLEILFGDDASTDATPQILQAYVKDRPHCRYFRIESQENGLRGKPNVLAQLARQATGDILLTTDADIRLPAAWAATVAGAFRVADVGIAAGPAVTTGSGLFGRLQGIDLVLGAAAIHALAQHGLPLTAAGNNMAFTKQAYTEAGGFEALPFSVTEDFELFRAIVAKGHAFRWLQTREACCLTAPVPSAAGLLRQRKRWFMGGRKGPWYGGALYALHSLQYPVLGGLCFTATWPLACAGLTLKVLLDGVLVASTARRLGVPKLLSAYPAYPAYPLYFTAMSLVLPFYFALPTGVRWKGRRY